MTEHENNRNTAKAAVKKAAHEMAMVEHENMLDIQRHAINDLEAAEADLKAALARHDALKALAEDAAVSVAYTLGMVHSTTIHRYGVAPARPTVVNMERPATSAGHHAV